MVVAASLCQSIQKACGFIWPVHAEHYFCFTQPLLRCRCSYGNSDVHSPVYFNPARRWFDHFMRPWLLSQGRVSFSAVLPLYGGKNRHHRVAWRKCQGRVSHGAAAKNAHGFPVTPRSGCPVPVSGIVRPAVRPSVRLPHVHSSRPWFLVTRPRPRFPVSRLPVLRSPS